MGIDLGSTTAKTVIIDDTGRRVAAQVIQMGAVSRAGVQRSIDAALIEADVGIAQIVNTIGTGYGRRLVPGVGRTFTEITCHARGVAAVCPGVRLVVDVGGQDSKAIAVDDFGLVEDFAMNDRCASGTGRFFEVLARAIECEVGELGELAIAGDRGLEVSSMCATFAETEVVSLLARGSAREDIAASVHSAVSARTLGLISQVGRRLPVVMTGGVARNSAAVTFLSEALGAPIMVPEQPQVTGAHGAAILAAESRVRSQAMSAGDIDHEIVAAYGQPMVPSCSECSVAHVSGSHSHPLNLGIDIPVRS
jgi:predicted CoA-substrate-specific enzyme activase